MVWFEPTRGPPRVDDTVRIESSFGGELVDGTTQESSLVLRSLRKILFPEEASLSSRSLRYRPLHLHSSSGTTTTTTTTSTASRFVLVPAAKATSNNYRQLKLTSNGGVIPALNRTWDNVGRIGGVAFPCLSEEPSNRNPPSTSSSSGNKPTKPKRKKNSSEKDNPPRKTTRDTNRPLTELLMQPLTTQTSVDKPHTKPSKKRTKSNSAHISDSCQEAFVLTEETFAGIEQSDICNAAFDEDSLALFLRQVHKDSQTHMAWSILFLDSHTTSPLLPSTQRFCSSTSSKKRNHCTHWNCTCDTHLRALQAKQPVMGLMIVCGRDIPATTEQPQQHQQQHDCFIIPLGKCNNSHGEPESLPPDYHRMTSWPLLPFCCDIPIARRWDIVRTLLTTNHNNPNCNFKCVTFQAVVSLMTLQFHFHHCLGKPLDLLLSKHIVDIQLLMWMIQPHAPEEELELEFIAKGFPHLLPTKSVSLLPSTLSVSTVLQGMLRAKDSLIFLWNLYPKVNKIIQLQGLEESLERIEGPIQSVLASMELLGVGIRPKRLSKIQRRIEHRLKDLQSKARLIASNDEFSLSSPQQVANLLYNTLGVSATRTDSIGISAEQSLHPSTSENTLQEIKTAYSSSSESSSPSSQQIISVIDILLEFRSISKLLTAFLRPLQRLARPSHDSESKVMCIHPMWMQTSVRTGRLSCRKPNMQQMPKNGGTFSDECYYSTPRDAFCASTEGYLLFSCDYSQNEVRILAHMSNDPVLISAFEDVNVDIYKQMSSYVTGKVLQDVTDQERAVTKQVVLAILYGMGVSQVAFKLQIDKNAAQRTIQAFFQRFSRVKQWMEEVKASARLNGFVTTITGRRRYIDINSTNDSLRAQAERQAINTVVQGSAADLIKLAMIKMASRIMDWRKEGGSMPPKLM